MVKSPEVTIKVVRNGYVVKDASGADYDTVSVFATFDELIGRLKDLLQDTADTAVV